MWGELSVGRIVQRLGANCPETGANCPETGGESSGANCLWGELSSIRVEISMISGTLLY